MVVHSDIAYVIARQRGAELRTQAARHTRRRALDHTGAHPIRARLIAVWAAVAGGRQPQPSVPATAGATPLGCRA